eukprot:Lithocolla_globosa_v1_NODE_5108_length_1304_cov_7.283427.p2 type:complete len:110 gc:universal NODE_5108_length_1304_cov_7.283427:645-316(-)
MKVLQPLAYLTDDHSYELLRNFVPLADFTCWSPRHIFHDDPQVVFVMVALKVLHNVGVVTLRVCSDFSLDDFNFFGISGSINHLYCNNLAVSLVQRFVDQPIRPSTNLF